MSAIVSVVGLGVFVVCLGLWVSMKALLVFSYSSLVFNPYFLGECLSSAIFASSIVLSVALWALFVARSQRTQGSICCCHHLEVEKYSSTVWFSRAESCCIFPCLSYIYSSSECLVSPTSLPPPAEEVQV